jgi:hypothetical protein
MRDSVEEDCVAKRLDDVFLSDQLNRVERLRPVFPVE